METVEEAKETPKQAEAEHTQPPVLEEETIEIKSKCRRSRLSTPGKRGRFPEAPVVHHELPLPEGAPGTPIRELYKDKPMPAGQRLDYEQPFF